MNKALQRCRPAPGRPPHQTTRTAATAPRSACKLRVKTPVPRSTHSNPRPCVSRPAIANNHRPVTGPSAGRRAKKLPFRNGGSSGPIQAPCDDCYNDGSGVGAADRKWRSSTYDPLPVAANPSAFRGHGQPANTGHVHGQSPRR
jgi:hypothetical protein